MFHHRPGLADLDRSSILILRGRAPERQHIWKVANTVVTSNPLESESPRTSFVVSATPLPDAGFSPVFPAGDRSDSDQSHDREAKSSRLAIGCGATLWQWRTRPARAQASPISQKQKRSCHKHELAEKTYGQDEVHLGRLRDYCDRRGVFFMGETHRRS
jgi:hypothetical protein